MTSLVASTGEQPLIVRGQKLAPVFNGATPKKLKDGSEIYTAEHDNRYYLMIFAGKDSWGRAKVSASFLREFERDAAISDFKKSLARLRKEKSKRR